MSRADDLWLELHVGLRDHPKTARLRRRLGVDLPTTIGLLGLLWAWAVRYAPDGNLSRYDPDVIADAAGWEHEPGVLVRALVGAGFLDEDLAIHDWDAYAGRLLDRRAANADRMRRSRQRIKERLNGEAFEHGRPDDDDMSGDRAAHVQGLPDITGHNLTGPDRTPTPQPPPATTREGGRLPRKRPTKGRTGPVLEARSGWAGCPAGCPTNHGGPLAAKVLGRDWLEVPAAERLPWPDFLAHHGRPDLADVPAPEAAIVTEEVP